MFGAHSKVIRCGDTEALLGLEYYRRYPAPGYQTPHRVYSGSEYDVSDSAKDVKTGIVRTEGNGGKEEICQGFHIRTSKNNFVRV